MVIFSFLEKTVLLSIVFCHFVLFSFIFAFKKKQPFKLGLPWEKKFNAIVGGTS